MPSEKTQMDALRVYLTGDPDATGWTHASSLGGSRMPIEAGQGFYVDSPIAGLLIELVATTVEGVGYLKATAGTLQFKAPSDSDYGTGVAIAAGETKILYSYTTGLGFVRVTNCYAVDSYTGISQITIMSEMENAIGQSFALTTGGTTYRALMLKNVSTYTLTSVWLRPTSGAGTYSIGVETPDSSGKIQIIADETTAPSGVTFYGYAAPITVTNLLPGQSIGLWIKKVVSAGASVSASHLATIQIQTMSSPDGTLLQYRSGRSRILSTAGLYSLFSGEDALPDFGAAPSDSAASLPVSVTITPPVSGTKTVYLTTRYTTTGGLESQNQYAHPFIIDSTGAIVTETLHPPENIVLTALDNCLLRITANYYAGFDDEDATDFYCWITTDGTDPDPSDTVTYTSAILPDGLTSGGYFNYICGPYSHGQEVKVLLRTYRSTDAVESSNTDINTATMTTTRLYGISQPQSLLDDSIADARAALGMPDFTLVENATGNIHWRVVRGQCRFYFDTECAFVITDGQFRTRYDIVMDSVSGTAANSGVECVDANTAYFAVNKVRRMKLDKTANQITIVSGVTAAPTQTLYAGPIYCTASLINFQCWIAGVWRTVAALASDGTFTTNLDMAMCSSDAELFA